MKKTFNYSSILLTGGNGFLGRHVYNSLINEGVPSKKIIVTSSKHSDLRDPKIVKELCKKTK